MEVLMKTLHGSHLYGLNHANSDTDYYVVVTRQPGGKKRQISQKINEFDITTIDLGSFLVQCQKGVPQALEAMFSQVAEIDKIAGLRSAYMALGGTETYLRTIKSFALGESAKTKRHALRLALNASEMGATGRFNPTLSQSQIDYITDYANNDGQVVYDEALRIVFSDYRREW